MSEASNPLLSPPDAHDRTGMPVVTMIAGALGLLLFAGLVFLMFSFNRRFYTPKDELTERVKQREDQRQADEALLNSYGKTETPGHFRIPINEAIGKVIDERNAE